MNEVQDADREGDEEGVLGHERLLYPKIRNDLRTSWQDPASRCDLHLGVAGDVPDPVGSSAVSGNDEQTMVEPLTR